MIKNNLKKILAINEITQKQLAEKTGIRLPTLSDLCTNKSKHIPIEVLNKICKELNCQPGDLLEYIPDNEK